ncbi:metal-dependent hydrolase [Sediminicola luteus]|uniref:Metal-dependent hydrolase n=1 Tax=Sediminicola luteus TaxID=319238 RepID=A0A2A4G3Z9_9FLAO|nr:metal-dependent hydrolase [Sediminicola luteus]PCE62686.1 metal-dependent hydrolase [Sediminicola luteus]
MDSLTQIVLGASVAEISLGRKIGNKAILWGAIAGTIPDLDVLARQFTDTLGAVEFHRGITHSLVFCLVLAPILGWLVSRIYRKKEATVKEWSLLFFWALVTHPLLDAHTTWGTQFFWPMDLRLAYKNIFVIDPLYTLPFLTCLLLAMRLKRTHPKRQFYARLGLWLSTAYLLVTLVIKLSMLQVFKAQLEAQQLTYTDISVKPTPFNSILWSANVATEDHYLIGYYSFFDADEQIRFSSYPKNHDLGQKLPETIELNRLINISEGWYILEQGPQESLRFHDLRFGMLSSDPAEKKFAFTYALQPKGDAVLVTEIPRNREDAPRILSSLWHRIWGNH